MKLAKKILAAFSAIAMTATMLSSLAVYAAGNPVLSMELRPVNEEDGIYDLAVLYDTSACGDLGTYTIQFNIQLDAAFDLEGKTDTATVESGIPGLTFNGFKGVEIPNMSILANPNKVANITKDNVFIFAVPTTTAFDFSSKAEVCILKNLQIRDGATIDDFEIKIVDFNSSLGTSSADTTAYGFANQNPDVVITPDAFESVIFPGNKPDVPPEPDKPEIPAATGATATGDQLLNLEPSDVGLGDKWTQDPDYATEDAVVSLANVKKDDAITGFTWEIKAADAEGNPLASEKTKKYFGVVGGLETGAEVTVGLVVGYDTTEWQSVEIVGVTAE